MRKPILLLGLLAIPYFAVACDDTSTTTDTSSSSSASSSTSSTSSTSSSSSSSGEGGAGGNGGNGGTGGSGGSNIKKNPLDGMGTVEKVQGNFMFTEGPQWISSKGTLLFSDIPANRIYEYTAPSAFATFRDPSANSNGLALDKKGLLHVCEHSGRRVSRTDANGMVTTVVDNYQGKKLNSPNDLIIRDDGNIYFTDPPYGLANPNMNELGFQGVFRVKPDGTLELIANDLDRPNGIALSPDQKTLYVDDTTTGDIRSYVLAADGTAGAMAKLVTTGGNPDGMAVDDQGNLFVSAMAGVEVYDSEGNLWGTITVPEQPANCAFGDGDRKTLYITARTSLYRVKLTSTGMY
ncbi:MAG TPA: SMP-30/gluconolactonase/LRE family protein [Polyangium sp.]|nr:SMP-30/gluconolactonase/LRE family protein [Polyangium sp.]